MKKNRLIISLVFFLWLSSGNSFAQYKRVFSHDTIFRTGNFKNIDSTLFLGSVKLNCVTANNYNEFFNWRADLFSKNVDLKDTRFTEGPDFSHSTFSGNISLENCFVNFGHTNFSYVKFSHLACLRNMILYGDNADMVFDNAYLPDTLDFSRNPRMRFEIDLTTANTSSYNRENNKTHYIFLYKSDISKFHLNYQDYRLLFIDPLTHYILTPDEKSFLYEGLLKNFKDRGQYHDYEVLDIEYRKFQWSLKPWYYRWTGYIVELLDDYGYDNAKIFTWIIGLLLFFTSINFLFLKKILEVYRIDNLQVVYKPKNVKERLLNVWYSFIYTSVIFFHPVIKLEKLDYKKVVGTIYIAIIYLVGLVLVGFAIHTIIS